MAKKATPWPQMIRAVYESFETGRHTGDHLTRRIMDRTVSWLTAGLTLSPKLQAALVRNINQRTRFVVEEPADGIRLTPDQIKYAKTTNPDWFGYGFEGVDLNEEDEGNVRGMKGQTSIIPPSIPLPFPDHSPSITLLFHHYSTYFPLQAMELAQELVSIAAEKGGSGASSCSVECPKDNEREEKKINHEGMSIPSDPLTHETSYTGVIAPPQLHVVHGPLDPLEHPIEDSSVKAHERKPAPRTHAPAITLWVKEDKRGTTRATGYLDLNGEKFALCFTSYDAAVEKLRTCFDREWQDFIAREVAPVFLPIEREATGVASTATMSALYGSKDTYGLKSPETGSTAVLLEWENGIPVLATIIDGEHITPVNLKNEAADRYKGSFKLAA